MFFFVINTPTKNNTHQLILIITGILLGIYIFKKADSEPKELEKENQQLKMEIQKLQKELEAQKAVVAAIEKSEERRN